jgi:hypothetical protein
MSSLHPVAQIAAIIVAGIMVVVYILAVTTDFFDNLTKRK